MNVAGGGSIKVHELIALAGEVVGQAVNVDRLPPQPGDVQQTGGSIERAHAVLGWEPAVDIRTGLTLQAEWHKTRLSGS
jgi:UDP-glucuronate 4-epimerase